MINSELNNAFILKLASPEEKRPSDARGCRLWIFSCTWTKGEPAQDPTGDVRLGCSETNGERLSRVERK